jgi:hypothetical protein
LVFPVVSFLLAFPPISYKHSSSPPFVLHAPQIKIRIHKILPVVLYALEPWSLKLREEHKLRVFESRAQKLFGRKRDKVREIRENCIMRNFKI